MGATCHLSPPRPLMAGVPESKRTTGTVTDTVVPIPPGLSTSPFESRYTMGRLLGMGSHSVVRSAFDNETGEELACKCLRLLSPGESPSSAVAASGSARPRSRDAIYRELWILHRVQCPGTARVKEFFEEGKDVFVLMERVRGQELMEALMSSTCGHFSEAESRDVTTQLLQSLATLHERNIVHRDLKFENIVQTGSSKGHKNVKIIDFGLAAYLPDGPLVESCGTPYYVAPEVLRQQNPYGTECDLWSLGVLLFAMLSGHMPFFSESIPQLFEMIAAGEYSFSQPAWDCVSDDAKDLVKQLLTVKPSDRISAQDALGHPWLAVA